MHTYIHTYIRDENSQYKKTMKVLKKVLLKRDIKIHFEEINSEIRGF